MKSFCKIKLLFRNYKIEVQKTACFEIIGQAPNPSGTHFAGFPTWLKVSPAVGIISPGQTVEVTLQHGDLRGQDLFSGTSGSSLPGANEVKAAALLVRITRIYSTVAKGYKIHVQHQNCRSTFSSRGYNFGDGFF